MIFPEMAKKFKNWRWRRRGKCWTREKNPDNVVLRQGEGRGCCGGGKVKQKKIEQSHGEQEEVS